MKNKASIIYLCCMIQRKQSLYLLGVIICKALLLVIPFGANTKTGNELLAQNNHFTLILVAATIIISVYTTLQFKNRKKQMRLTKMLIALVITFFLAAHMAVHESLFDFSIDAIIGSLRIGIILSMLSLVFLFLAHKGIQSDEKLVKSVDRLR